MTEPRVTRKKLTDLLPDMHNANRGTERGHRALDDSVNEVGLGRSILTDKNGVVIAGNKTHSAAIENGFEDVIEVETDGNTLVVVKRTDLDLNDPDPNNRARKAAYYDNRVGQLSLDWNPEQLLADMQTGVNFDNLFSKDELAELLAGVVEDEQLPDAGGQIDRAEELAAEYGTTTGQVWQLGRHRLVIGDCTDSAIVDGLMQGEKANAVLTDPPYGQNQNGVSNDEPEKLTGIISGSVDVLPITDGVIIAFQSPRTFPEWLDQTRRKGYKFERMFWLYKQAQMAFPFRGWLLKSEAILVSSVGEAHWNDVHPYVHDCYMLSEVSGELSEDSGWHGSVKPLSVVKDLMSRISVDGDIIYDPFLGSGTTLIAAEQLNRVCYGCEIHLPSAAVIIHRWEVTTGQKAQRLKDCGLEPHKVS